jgi:hypothetical protein
MVHKTKKQFWVGISQPYGQSKLMWDVAQNIDFLSPDLLAKAKGVDLPLKRIEASSENEAVKIYKSEVPQVAKWKLTRGWI